MRERAESSTQFSTSPPFRRSVEEKLFIRDFPVPKKRFFPAFRHRPVMRPTLPFDSSRMDQSERRGRTRRKYHLHCNFLGGGGFFCLYSLRYGLRHVRPAHGQLRLQHLHLELQAVLLHRQDRVLVHGAAQEGGREGCDWSGWFGKSLVAESVLI